MNIIPKPQSYAKLGGEFTITSATKVYCEEMFATVVQSFVQMVKDSCGYTLDFVSDITEAQIIFIHTDDCNAEGYTVMISDGLATVSAFDQAGAFYAVETLRQLFDLDNSHEIATYGNCYIYDSPKFAYRGLSVDICRHFFPLSTLKQIVELMSRVKLNKLHLHLSDDQGFRLEMEKYPLLNTISSTRSGSEVVANGNRSVDNNPVSGYLTKADARELVEFASQHQIQIVPELDIPGHSVAMLAAYPQYSCEGTPLEVRQKWGVSKDVLCAGNDETYAFVKDILDEVCEVFPGNLVHLGGDEVPKDRWCNCPKCRSKLSDLKLDNYDQLQSYMIEQFRSYLETKGKTVICWNDGITKWTSAEIVSQAWKPLSRHSAIKSINKGRKTIMSPSFSLYFDYPYAMTPLNKTFKFNATKGVKKDKLSNVLGVEGALWTEYIATEEKLFFHLLPRMTALAECAWGNNTGDFHKRVCAYTSLYEKLGLTYNKKATKVSCRKPSVIKKYYTKNSNIELDKQNKSKQ